MALSLLDAVKSYFTDSTLTDLAAILGEKKDNVAKATDGLIPTVLANFAAKSSDLDLFGICKDAGQSGLLENLSSLIKQPVLLENGKELASHLFGKQSTNMAEEISKYASISQGSAEKLISFATPVTTAVLGKRIEENNWDISSFNNSLNNEKSSWLKMIPAGLGSLAAFLGLGKITDFVGNFADGATDKVKDAGAAISGFAGNVTDRSRDAASTVTTGATKTVGNTVSGAKDAGAAVTGAIGGAAAGIGSTFNNNNEEDKKQGVAGWLLPLLLVGGLGAGAYYFFTKDKKAVDPVIDPVTATTDVTTTTPTTTVVPVAKTPEELAVEEAAKIKSSGLVVDAKGNVTGYDFGKMKEVTLADGKKIQVEENGFENRLLGSITDKAFTVSDDKSQGWLEVYGFQFETGKASLKQESFKRLENLAAILVANPTVDLKIGGYTDNIGDSLGNVKLSEGRANYVIAELGKKGVVATRLKGEGYGPQHPAASNATTAGKALNRRVAVRITKK